MCVCSRGSSFGTGEWKSMHVTLLALGGIQPQNDGKKVEVRELSCPSPKFSPWLNVNALLFYMDVSERRGTPKSSVLIGFSIINHSFWGTTIFGNIHIIHSIRNSARICKKKPPPTFPFPHGDGDRPTVRFAREEFLQYWALIKLWCLGVVMWSPVSVSLHRQEVFFSKGK